MIRLIAFASALTLFAIGAPGVCGPNSAAPAYAVLPGWTMLLDDGVSVIWVQPGPSSDLSRVWVRREFLALHGVGRTYQSVRWLYEVDCGPPRYRILQRSSFEEPQLRGAEMREPRRSLLWEYARPDSSTERVVDYACHRPGAPRPPPQRLSRPCPRFSLAKLHRVPIVRSARVKPAK